MSVSEWERAALGLLGLAAFLWVLRGLIGMLLRHWLRRRFWG